MNEETENKKIDISELEKKVADLRQEIDDIVFNNNQAKLKATSEASWMVVGVSLSNSVLTESDAIKTTTICNSTWELLKEIKIRTKGDYRVKFSYKSDVYPGGYEFNVQLYKNGVAIGSEYYTYFNSWQDYSMDVTGLVRDDLIQVWGMVYYACGIYTGSVKDFKVCGAPEITLSDIAIPIVTLD